MVTIACASPSHDAVVVTANDSSLIAAMRIAGRRLKGETGGNWVLYNGVVGCERSVIEDGERVRDCSAGRSMSRPGLHDSKI